MNATRFRKLAASNGPFASVYIDDSHNTEDARHAVELRWRALKDELDAVGAPGEVIAAVGDLVLDGTPPVGRSGRAVIAGPDGVLVDEHLLRPPVTPVARWSPAPYLIPLIEHGAEAPRHAVVAVDHTGADIEVLDESGKVVVSETVDGKGYPVHHASSAESPGYGDPQQRSDEQSRQNVRGIAVRLTALVDDEKPERLFVIGETTSVSDLTAELPQRVADLVVDLQLGARHSTISTEDRQKAIAVELERAHNRELADTAERFEAGIGHDPAVAVEGLTSVCGALRNGEVDTLIIGDVGDATVVDGGDLLTLAPTPEILSELGVGPERTLRADEALPMAAVAIGAELVRIDERITPKDGVAAVLRFAPRSSADDAG